jgi:hypothetical protein
MARRASTVATDVRFMFNPVSQEDAFPLIRVNAVRIGSTAVLNWLGGAMRLEGCVRAEAAHQAVWPGCGPFDTLLAAP